jgi:predicted transcriptional regulator
MKIALLRKPDDIKLVNDKQLALSTLGALPDTASLHDIREELEILESIKDGQKAAREGRTKTQEEVEQLFASWNSK